MPTYNFEHKDTGEVIEKYMRISEKDGWLEDNPEWKSVILQAPSFTGDHITATTKSMDGGMKEVLDRVANAHPTSPLADRYGDKKTTKELKTKDVLKKHGVM